MGFTRRGGGEEEVMNHRARTSAPCLRHASSTTGRVHLRHVCVMLALERAFVKAGILRVECSLSKQDANIKCNSHVGPLADNDTYNAHLTTP